MYPTLQQTFVRINCKNWLISDQPLKKYLIIITTIFFHENNLKLFKTWKYIKEIINKTKKVTVKLTAANELSKSLAKWTPTSKHHCELPPFSN